MRASAPFLIALLCAGCGSTSIQVGADDTAGNDTATGGGNGGGGNGGGGDDTAPIDDTAPAAPIAYTGRLDGVMHFTQGGGGGGGQTPPDMVCTGSTSFTVSPDGALAGSASCTIDTPQGTQTLDGELSGSATSGMATVSWTVQAGPDTLDLPFTGTVSATHAALTGSLDIPNAGTFTATITADAS